MARQGWIAGGLGDFLYEFPLATSIVVLPVCLIWRDRGRDDSSSYSATLFSLQIMVYLTNIYGAYELRNSPEIQISSERQTQFPLSEGSPGRKSGSRVSH